MGGDLNVVRRRLELDRVRRFELEPDTQDATAFRSDRAAVLDDSRLDLSHAEDELDERSQADLVLAMLREDDQTSVTEVAKKHGVSEQTLYTWRKRYDELDGTRTRG